MLDSLDLPELRRIAQEDKKSEQKRSQYGWILLIVCFVLGSSAPIVMARFISITPETPFYVLFAPFAFFAVIAAIGTLWLHRPSARIHQRIDQYAPAFVARSKPAYDWNSVIFSVVILIAIIGMALSIVSPLVTIIIALYPVLYRMLFGWLLGWVRRGTHSQRLQRMDLLLRFLPNNRNLHLFKASMLHQAGDTQTATQIYREILMNPRYTGNPFMTSIYLNDLAYMLVLDKKFEGTLPMLEAAIRISPHIGSFYDSLAAYYLEQSIHPERALELTQTAVEYTDKQLIEPLAIQKATSARALALSGYHSNANALLGEALAVLKRLTVPLQAEIHRQAGHTRRTQGDEDGAREYFSKAVQLDPDGLYGRLAQRDLDSNS